MEKTLPAFRQPREKGEAASDEKHNNFVLMGNIVHIFRFFARGGFWASKPCFKIENKGEQPSGMLRTAVFSCTKIFYFFAFSSLRRETMMQTRQTMKPRTQMGPAVRITFIMNELENNFGVKYLAFSIAMVLSFISLAE